MFLCIRVSWLKYITEVINFLEKNRNPYNFKITFFCLERNSLLFMLRTTNNQAIILVSHNYLPFCLTCLNNFWSYFSHYSLSHLLCLNNWVVDLIAKPKMCIQIPNLKFNKKLIEQYQCLWLFMLNHTVF